MRTPRLSQDSEVKLSVVELLASLIYQETLFRWEEEPLVPGVLGAWSGAEQGLSACVFNKIPRRSSSKRNLTTLSSGTWGLSVTVFNAHGLGQVSDHTVPLLCSL